MLSIPEKTIEEIRAKRDAGMSWLDLVRQTGFSLYVLKCAVDPNFRGDLRMKVKQSRARRRNGFSRLPGLKKADEVRTSDPDGKNRFGHFAIGESVKSISIPQSVEEQREKLANFRHANLTAVLLGDPPPWRSALGKKMGLR